MPVSWQSLCRPPAAPDDQQHTRDVAEDASGPGGVGKKLYARPPKAEHHDAESDQKKHERAAEPKDHLPGRSRRRAARLECRRAIALSTSATGSPSPQAGRSRTNRLAFPGPGAALPSTACGAVPPADSHRAQAAPNTASKTATGKPNNATRPQAAPRMEAAAIGTGENKAETVARRNRQRRRDHVGLALGRRAAADGPKQRREQGKGGGGRSADSGNQAQKRRQPGGPQPSPAIEFCREPIGSRRAFGKTGNKAGGNDHQSGRIDRLGKTRAKGLAEKADGESGGQAKRRADDHDRKKRMKMPRPCCDDQNDDRCK